MAGSQRTTTRIGHLFSSTKNKEKTKKIPPKSLSSNNTSNRFKFIMTPTSGKTCGLRRRNGTITLSSQKPRAVRNMLL